MGGMALRGREGDPRIRQHLSKRPTGSRYAGVGNGVGLGIRGQAVKAASSFVPSFTV